MKPPPFTYHRPSSTAQAVGLLASLGEDAKVLAGGQSLVPLMNLRLAAPGHVIDLAGIDELVGIAVGSSETVIGAMTTYAQVEDDPAVARSVPLLAEAMPRIAHRTIRHRGTIGGSLAHGDPAAEVPAVALTLDASFRVASVRGTRSIAAGDFFEGPYMTSLLHDELIVDVTWPNAAPGTVSAVVAIERRPADYALAGLAASVGIEGGQILDPRLTAFATGPKPHRLVEAEAMLAGCAAGAVDADHVVDVALGELEREVGHDGGASYPQAVFGTLVRSLLRTVGENGP